MSRLLKGNRGLTLLEVLMSVFLISIVFLGVTSLYVASQRFYIGSSDKVIIAYEAQYAIQHIYRYAMQGIGDKNTPAFHITDATQLDININHNDPLTKANYSNVTSYSYRYDPEAKALMFQDGANPEQSLIPKVNVTEVNFTSSANALTGYITASYNNQSLTFYFSCYPRLASFN